RRLLAASQSWARHPPAAGIDRFVLVSDVHDHVDVAAVSRHSRSQMHVASARIEVAMRAGPSGLVLPEALRPHGVGEAPDEDALVVGLRGMSTPPLPDFLERRDHLVFA